MMLKNSINSSKIGSATNIMINTIKVKKMVDTAIVPTYGSEESACFDLYVDMRDQEECVIQPHETVKLGTGLAFELPDTCYMEIKQRSGLASKGVFPVGGICDADYRGEVMVLLHNGSNQPYTVKDHDRIAQAICCHYNHLDFYISDELTETERGNNGFGSSGK